MVVWMRNLLSMITATPRHGSAAIARATPAREGPSLPRAADRLLPP